MIFKKTVFKKILIVVLCIIAAIVVVAAGYVAYVFIDYSRIDDMQNIEVGVPTENEGLNELSIGNTYTIFTQNLGFGAYTPEFTFFMDGGSESRAASEESVRKCISSGAATAASFEPDFVMFQEVDFGSTRSYQVDERKMLIDAFADYYSAFAVNYHSAYLMYPVFEPHGASNSGIITLSRGKITDALRRSLPISESFSKILDLDRCYLVTRIPVEDGRELVIFNVHLSAYGGSDEIRENQMNMLFSNIKEEYDKGNYCICGGDFNHDITGDSVTVLNGANAVRYGWTQPFPKEYLPDHVKLITDYACGTQMPTCRNTDIAYCSENYVAIVDGFLVTDNISVEYLENVQTDFAYSDHNPVVMKFKLG